MEIVAVVIATAAFAWSVGWSVFEYRARSAGDRASSALVEGAVAEARRAADAAERSAASAEVASGIEMARADAAQRAELHILFWESRARTEAGPGLVLHNTGQATAHDIVGTRLMPTGSYEESSALKTLGPGERRGINLGWTAAQAPPDAPLPRPGHYTGRVTWTDAAGVHQTDWLEVEKR